MVAQKKALRMIGGTVMCGKREEDGLLYPIYTHTHIKLALTISENKEHIPEEERKALYESILKTKDVLFQRKFIPNNVTHDEGYSDDVNMNYLHQILNILQNINKHLPKERQIEIEKDGLSNKSSNVDLEVLYNIDSIDFDFYNDHFYTLQESAAEAFELYDHVEVSGGTDTIQYYATALARDLESRRVFAGNGNNKKLFFISSMDSMEANLPHNAELFNIADQLGKDPRLAAGGYVLSSSDKDASGVYIHDPLNDFVKVSSKLHDSFRSKEPVGYYENGELHLNPNYKKPESTLNLPHGVRKITISSVAAPILHGTTLSEAVKVMAAYLEADQAFDSVVLEFNAKEMISSNPSFEHLEELIKAHASRGTRVVINNYLKYDNNSKEIKPTTPEDKFNENMFIKRLEDAGAIISTRTTKDAVVDEILSNYKAYSHKTGKKFPLSDGLKIALDEPAKTAVLGYIPMSKDMIISSKLLSGVVKAPVIAGLPGNTLPKTIVENLQKNFQDRFKISFVENGVMHKIGAGQHDTFVEGVNESKYAAGAASNEFSSGILRPEQVAAQARGLRIS